MLTSCWTKSTITSGVCMYRIGELAKMAEVTP
ncbi:MAG TPA: zinc-responsive transcriptional regulator, partial [Shigella sp.]|nr:zinc-responsive transcriptional regulator [Shigella sp.]